MNDPRFIICIAAFAALVAMHSIQVAFSTVSALDCNFSYTFIYIYIYMQKLEAATIIWLPDIHHGKGNKEVTKDNFIVLWEPVQIPKSGMMNSWYFSEFWQS